MDNIRINLFIAHLNSTDSIINNLLTFNCNFYSESLHITRGIIYYLLL